MRDIAILRYTLLSPLFWISVTCAIVYGINGRSSHGGFWNVILHVHLSSSVFALVVLPVWLLFLLLRNRSASGPEFLIRHGSYLAAWWSGLRSASGSWLALAFGWVLGLEASALGLSLNTDIDGAGAVSTALENGVHPVWLIAGQTLLQAGFALAAAALLQALALAWRSLIPQVLLALALFAWFLAGASGALPDDAPYDVSTYTQVQLLLTSPPMALVALGVEALILAVAAIAMRAADRAAALASSSRWVNVVTIHWVLSSLLIAIRLQDHRGDSFENSAVAALVGNAGAATDAVIWSFIYCGSVAALVITRLRSSGDLLDLELLRAGSLPAWTRGMFQQNALALSLLTAALPLPGILVSCVLGGPGLAHPYNAALLGWALFVNTSIHTWLLLGAAVLGVVLFRSGTRAFGAVTVCFLLTVIPQSTSSWWPFGAANLARVEFGAGPVLLATVSMLLTTSAVWLAAALSFCLRSITKGFTWAR